MANIKIAYATSTAITITLNSMSASATAGRESNSVDNTTNLYTDAIISLNVTLATGTPSLSVDVYVAGSEDGTNWPDGVTGSDAAYTIKTPTNLAKAKAILTATAGGLLWRMNPIAIAQFFGGVLPRKWSVIVVDNSSLALASSGNALTYTGVYYTSV